MSLFGLLRETLGGTATTYLALFPEDEGVMLPCTAFCLRFSQGSLAHRLLQNIKLSTTEKKHSYTPKLSTAGFGDQHP